MNRHQRRAAKPQGRNVSRLDRVVAIHEAGHAVARILTAHDLGLNPDQAITYIEVGSRENLGVCFDGKAKLISQAITIGPTLSANIQSVFNRITAGKAASELVGKYIAEAIAVARSEAIDVEKWLRARMLISICGPAAEAWHTGRTLESVWNSYESETDLTGAVQDGVWASLSASDITRFIDDGIERATALVAQIHVQNAICELANALPKNGRLSGRRAAFTITQALEMERGRKIDLSL